MTFPKNKVLIGLICWIFLAIEAPAQMVQTQTDSYTRYELLEPNSQSFRIIYDVSATTEGAKYYFNTLRKGSEHTVDAVFDRMTGKELEWSIVDGTEAKRNGHSRASEDTDYLQVKLARPITERSEYRLRIDKTYQDAQSYFTEEGKIVFSRSLGIKRNAIVLPVGYEIVGSNYPVQVETESDGRIKASFMNRGPRAVPLRIEAQKLTKPIKPTALKSKYEPWPKYTPKPSGRDKSHARLDYNFRERSFQNREIVYYLQQPETHSFRLYHDYTETRVGVDKYLNVVRKGSKASNPSAFILDTGEELKVETLKGQAITQKGIKLSTPPSEDTEVVVIWFDPVKKGQSTRLRIWETYTDPNRYLLYNDQLVWDRSFGRNRNDVVLPEGWTLMQCSIPGTISLTDDGLIKLSFVNDRPDNIDVHIIANRK